jgi:glycosyltransferase involved in cell wall biosynthesis
MREVQAKGHAITLIAPDYSMSSPDNPADDVIRISSWQLPFAHDSRMMKPGRVLELCERLRGWNYDVVHVQTPFIAHSVGTALARRLHLPVVESYHTFYDEYFYHHAPVAPRPWLQLAARRLSKFQCNRVDMVLVPSTPMRDTLLSYGIRRTISVIPTGIDTHFFTFGDGARFRNAYGIAQDRPMLAHVGRLIREKNIDFLLDVLNEVRRQVPNVLLVISGVGPLEWDLRAQAERLELLQNVLFIGNLDRARGLIDCYRAADAFVFAARTETQGIALLEALAAGLPVVATASRATREVLEASGALIANADVNDFAADVVKLLRDAELRSRLAESGREQVQRWSASVAAEQTLDCYQEVITAYAGPARVRAAAR